MRHASESSTSCPSISASKKINQTQTSTLGVNTWGLSVDGGTNYLTLPNGPVVPYDEVFGKVVDAWGIIFEQARDLSVSLSAEMGVFDGEFSLEIFRIDPYFTIPPGASDYEILLIVMDVINQGLDDLNSIFSFSASDIDLLAPDYTYAQIAWMFTAVYYAEGMGENIPLFNSTIADLRSGFELSGQMSDSQVLAESFAIIRNRGDISNSTQDIFRQYRQMLTIKTKNSNVINDLTTITAGVKVDHSMLVGNYATRVMFTAIPNDRPVAVITSVAPPDELTFGGGDTLTLTGVNFDYLSKVYISRVNMLPCESLTIINDITATCIIPMELPSDGDHYLGEFRVSNILLTSSIFGDISEGISIPMGIPS
jgi:hypothetical protein